MQDGFTIFWQNNNRARDLFDDLVARIHRNAYDDDYLAALDAYQAEMPDTAHFYILAARYLTAHGAYDAALPLAERAYRLRPVDYAVWNLLAEIYEHLGRPLDALTMRGYSYGIYKTPEPRIDDLPPELLNEGLNRLSVAMSEGKVAPVLTCRAVIEDGQLSFRDDLFVGEELPLTMPEGSARFWVGCYGENRFLSEKGFMLEELRRSARFKNCGHHDFVLDLQKAREVRGTTEIDVPEGREALIAIAGTELSQELSFQTETVDDHTYLGKWAFSYFRLSEKTTLHVDESAPYVLGTPILLGHSPRRKKLVLNILVDALSWPVMRTRFTEYMPRIAAFFSRGVIFDDHFSTSEFTYPALAAIETGRYPTHTQVVSEEDSHELPLDMTTLSECMKDLGYYCAAPMSSGYSMYCGAMRGYDRIVATSWDLPAFDGAERTIRHLEAFGETDQFLFLHVMDVHPYAAKGFKFATSVETRLPLARRLLGAQGTEASVRLPNFEIYRAQFLEGARYVDRSVGVLLDYIRTHYDEDEYIVNLYSDHGVSIFSPNADGAVDIMGPYSTGASWMMRGAGVPAAGVVNELTSSVDIYAALGHLCGFPVAPDVDSNLPAVFGGREREAVYSISRYPGQTLKVAVRSKTHTLRLETDEVVAKDGTVDLGGAYPDIFPRAHEAEPGYAVDSEELRAFFYPRARTFLREVANNGEYFPHP